MTKISASQITYAQFKNVVDSVGPVLHMFYKASSGNVNNIEGTFVSPHYTFGASIDPPVSVASLLADFPSAIDANVSVI